MTAVPEVPEIDYEAMMRLALELARESETADEVPVGAVVVRISDGMILGRGRDRKVEFSDPTAHAEILAMREAAVALGDWRLIGCALVVTLEPCAMCAGASLLARIPLLVYGATNPKFGAICTQMQILNHDGWNHRVHVIPGVLSAECGQILSGYFGRKRLGN